MWCKERGITNLRGAPYRPATNGAAERLVQTFKQAPRKSDHPTKRTLQEFLQQYRRTPLPAGYSPSELLHGRQIRTQIDLLLPSPAHRFQQKQCEKSAAAPARDTGTAMYPVGTPCYAFYHGPRRDKDARWVPAKVVKVQGERCVNVRVVPHGPVWRRHVDQLRPRLQSDEDVDIDAASTTAPESYSPSVPPISRPAPPPDEQPGPDPLPVLRRSERVKRPVQRYDAYANP